MNRLLVALLAAFDAVIVVAVGVAAALAPMTLLWVFGGAGADAGALWPAAGTLWQAGHLVPLHVAMDAEYAAAVGIPDEASRFVFSLAPLAFAVFTAVFAARSGARAARAGAWPAGVLAGTAVVAVLATLVALTSTLGVVGVETWQGVLLPTAVFAASSLAGALVHAWREGDDGILDLLRDRVDLDDTGIVESSARGIAAALAGLVAVGAAVTAIGVVAAGGRMVALFEAAHVDLAGAIVVGLGQLAYLPNLVIWGAAYAAGPGFALGEGTTVSPGGTDLGVIPGIPVLGIIPEEPSAWLLLLALLVVAVGAAAGWIARIRLLAAHRGEEPFGPRVIVLAVVVAGSAAGAAVLAVVGSGALGPDRLQQTGPSVGAFALAVAIEIALGAGAVLLAPRGDHARMAEASPPVDWAGADPRRPDLGRGFESSGPAGGGERP